jgi:hypothetical protein
MSEGSLCATGPRATGRHNSRQPHLQVYVGFATGMYIRGWNVCKMVLPMTFGHLQGTAGTAVQPCTRLMQRGGGGGGRRQGVGVARAVGCGGCPGIPVGAIGGAAVRVGRGGGPGLPFGGDTYPSSLCKRRAGGSCLGHAPVRLATRGGGAAAARGQQGSRISSSCCLRCGCTAPWYGCWV